MSLKQQLIEIERHDMEAAQNPYSRFQGRNTFYFKIFLIATVILLLFFALPSKPPLMMISAQSRGVSFDVSNSDETTVRFQSPVEIMTELGEKRVCASGLLIPANGAQLDYNVMQNSLLITGYSNNLDVPLRFIDDTKRNTPTEISNSGYLYYGKDSVCNDDSFFQPVRLPIWGTTKLGVVPTPPTQASKADNIGNIILSGDVKVFGRNIFGAGIYPAGEFSLPAGSQLLNDENYGKIQPKPWHGFALYDPNEAGITSHHVMDVHATTIAKRLHFIRLGAGANPEKIDVGVLTKIFGDPFLSGVGAFFAFLFFLSEFLLALRSLRRDE